MAPQPLLLATRNEAGTNETFLRAGIPLGSPRGDAAFHAVSAVDGYGVLGESVLGFGVKGAQMASAAPETTSGGVLGHALAKNSTGVVGTANNGVLAYGVWGTSTSGFAGYFDGRVFVNGRLEASSGGFLSDHPLDPEKRYLRHSFVESPDALDVYSGNVTTDEGGSATVELPQYVEALNEDVHYQLTVVGTFAHAVVAEELSDGRFIVKTDQPNCKVCWQVTGVRRPAFAGPYRGGTEEEKPPERRGTYINPEAFGQPAERAEGHARNEALLMALERREEPGTAEPAS
jgi:hypothetical protein